MPKDFNTYDVVVAVDEATAQSIREQLPRERDELCAPRNGAPFGRHVEVLSDFVDAYDVLLEQEAPAAPPGLAPGVLTKEGLQRLRPGEPLRGVPPQVSVGSPLCNLPDCWQDAEGSEV